MSVYKFIQKLSLCKSVSSDHDVVIVGLTQAIDQPLVGVPTEIDKAFSKKYLTSVLEMAFDLGATRTPKTAVTLPASGPRLIVVGLGDPDVDPARIRKAVAKAVRALPPSEKPLRVAISLELADPELIETAAITAVLASYSIKRVSAEPASVKVASFDIVSSNMGSEAKDAIARASEIAQAVCMARDLINQPPNLLYPESFVTAIRNEAKTLKIDVDVLDEKALERGGYGGLTAVGGGSSRPPRLLRMEYAPRGATKTIAFVGKGITFDSGGLDIKPASGMVTMKCDMSGAAAVATATLAIAALKTKVRVVTYAALAENLPSSTAYRPSDVLSMYGGKTVENVNTDAEGRLVLADALARSNEDDPDLVIDVATLTGACIVALGSRVSGLMASDNATVDLILDAAESAGEDFWHLPITDHARESLSSTIADTKSGSSKKVGGALAAAAFLQLFVDEGRPWAHLDIAGPAFNEDGAYDDVPSGGTGAAVRTLVSLASLLAK